MKFHARINTIVLFSEIFRLMQPLLSDIGYWKGSEHAKTLAKSGIKDIILLSN